MGDPHGVEDEDADEAELEAFKAAAVVQLKVFVNDYFKQQPTVFGDPISTGLFLVPLPKAEAEEVRCPWATAA